MKVLVTGASGRLGSCVCRFLHRAGISFRAVDRVASECADYKIESFELREGVALEGLFDGISVLAHFANHTNWNCGAPEVIYGENVTVNMNLFQAASNAGVERIVFSSTIQVLDGELPIDDRMRQEVVIPYIPIDSEMPAFPKNAYSLSKDASEQMLKYFAQGHGMTCVAIRYPWLVGTFFMEKVLKGDGPARGKCHDGFAYLPVYSAAEAAIAAMTAEVSGYRCYFVAANDNLAQRDARELVETYLSDLPRKKALEEMDSLVDCSVVEKELGWEQPLTLAESLEKYAHLEDVRP